MPVTSNATSWLSRSKSKKHQAAAAAPGGLSIVTSIGSSTSTTHSVNADEPAQPVTTQKIVGAVKDEWPLYSCDKEDYIIKEPIGLGASSVVHVAEYRATKDSAPIECAVKIIDVDRLGSVKQIDRLRREIQLMALSKHPNVLRVRGQWIEGSKLCIAVRYMAAGSLADIAKYAWNDGFEETVIATVLQQALHGLHYLHRNGWIHRDVKAANLLVDNDGTVLLADFGVSATLFSDPTSPKTSSRLVSRKSFVGSPCWMAPEVVERRPYDSKADIWSFGITALELANGRPPYALYEPAKAMTKTVIEDAPVLDREGGRFKYSKQMAQMIESCLVKDPTKRPSAEKLLSHPFFKQHAKKKAFLVSAILDGLPPLKDRQQRESLHSPGLSDTLGSWNFDMTMPMTPRLMNESEGGQFPGTAVAAAKSTGTPPGSGRRQSSVDGRMGALRSIFRTREGSAASTNRHRRGISFDEGPNSTSTKEG